MARILLAEDEPRISSFVTRGLEAHEFTVSATADGQEALNWGLFGEFDLMVLDIGLVGIDGFEVLRRLRGGGSDLPVIVLTARDSVADTVAGLEGGADDYMAKPFSLDELLARIRLRLRQRATVPEGGSATVLVVGDVSLDIRARTANRGEVTVELSSREFSLLEMLLSHAGQVLSREQILSGVWGYDYDPGSNVVEVYVRNLRRKLGDDLIETVRGMGYRLRV
ncbi:MAG: response regulator transcription factor [Actinobacteria bacterium]|jgi:DNA-binding response OmpR family regulator|nr:response regulator transcription factor [Actinomycetota bacterium]